jgi:hypothetical protein
LPGLATFTGASRDEAPPAGQGASRDEASHLAPPALSKACHDFGIGVASGRANRKRGRIRRNGSSSTRGANEARLPIPHLQARVPPMLEDSESHSISGKATACPSSHGPQVSRPLPGPVEPWARQGLPSAHSDRDAALEWP